MSDVLTRLILEREEGWSSTPYRDTLGYPTIGGGIKIGDKGDPLPKFELPKPVGDAWMQYHINDIRGQLSNELEGLSEARQSIIISMAYQMGINGALGFTGMWKAIRAGDWVTAADEMLDSLWASEKQTPARAMRHAKVMRAGCAEGIY